MNLPLPPDRPMPGAEQMLERILAERPPVQRPRWLLVGVVGVLVLATAIVVPRLLDSQQAISLATPSATASTASGSASAAGSTSVSPASPTTGRSPTGMGGPACLVERPAAWDALLDEYRMAAPPAGTQSVGVLEVGLDGQVVTVRVGEGEQRWLEYGPLDRSTTQTVMPIGAQTMLADFDTDGETYIFNATVNGVPQTRYLWRPGTEPVPAAGPASAVQAQQNGNSIWLKGSGDDAVLVIQRADGTEEGTPAPGVIDLATQGNTIWLLDADGLITGHDLTSLALVQHPLTGIGFPGLDGLPLALFSDGQRLGKLYQTGAAIVMPTQTDFRVITMATDDTARWSISGNHASWLQGVWPDAQYRIWDIRTNAVTTLPAPGGKSEGWTGVRNGYLIVHDDPLRPAVVPLDRLGMLYWAC